jgi:hypothetical protein
LKENVLLFLEGKDLAIIFGSKKNAVYLFQRAMCLKMTASYAVREMMKQAQVRPKGAIIKHGKKQAAERNAVPRRKPSYSYASSQAGKAGDGNPETVINKIRDTATVCRNSAKEGKSETD